MDGFEIYNNEPLGQKWVYKFGGWERDEEEFKFFLNIRGLVERFRQCIHRGNVKDENSNRYQIVFTLFQLILTQMVHDCVDNFKIKKNYDRQMRGYNKIKQKDIDGFEI